MTAPQLGFIRAIGVVILAAVVHYFTDQANLIPVMSEGVAAIVAALALAYEHSIENKGGGALFGAVHQK